MAEPAEHILAKYRPKVMPQLAVSGELYLRTEDALALCDDFRADGLAVNSLEAFIWRDGTLYVPGNWVKACYVVIGESWPDYRDRVTAEVKALICRLKALDANVFCIEATNKQEWEEEVEDAKRRKRQS